MAAKKKAAKKAARTKAATKKATSGKATPKKAAAKKRPARTAASKPAAKKAPARKTEKKPAAAPAQAKAQPRSGISVLDVNLGHIQKLRPRVTSFRPDDLRRAKDLLVEERFDSVEEAARAVAQKAIDTTREGAPPRGRSRR